MSEAGNPTGILTLSPCVFRRFGGGMTILYHSLSLKVMVGGELLRQLCSLLSRSGGHPVRMLPGELREGGGLAALLNDGFLTVAGGDPLEPLRALEGALHPAVRSLRILSPGPADLSESLELFASLAPRSLKGRRIIIDFGGGPPEWPLIEGIAALVKNEFHGALGDVALEIRAAFKGIDKEKGRLLTANDMNIRHLWQGAGEEHLSRSLKAFASMGLRPHVALPVDFTNVTRLSELCRFLSHDLECRDIWLLPSFLQRGGPVPARFAAGKMIEAFCLLRRSGAREHTILEKIDAFVNEVPLFHSGECGHEQLILAPGRNKVMNSPSEKHSSPGECLRCPAAGLCGMSCRCLSGATSMECTGAYYLFNMTVLEWMLDELAMNMNPIAGTFPVWPAAKAAKSRRQYHS
ncbi:MAG: hypothetical protein RDV48_15785 [Candidatus Eremiobacteraeota bacterium]|nr:hypothetical protein [Candidatus Eremiobacteraeota bacterium]